MLALRVSIQVQSLTSKMGTYMQPGGMTSTKAGVNSEHSYVWPNKKSQ